MACMGRTSRSRRPCARGEVLCTEPGKSHPCPDRQAGPVHEGNSRTMNMHADENSDGVIVPEKRPNKEGLPSAEAVEGRTPPKGNGGETAAARTLRRDNASNGLIAVRGAARQSKSVRFTALLHHITIDLLKRSYRWLERDSAPGIDGVTWQTYGENLVEKLKELHDKVHRGSYRARPARRTYIPKADGSKRPAGGRDLTIPLILNEPVNIGEKRLLEHELRELLHKRLQSSLLHGWHELVVQTALTEQGMCSPLGGAGFEMFIEAESFAGGTE